MASGEEGVVCAKTREMVMGWAKNALVGHELGERLVFYMYMSV